MPSGAFHDGHLGRRANMLSVRDVDPAGDRRHPFPVHPLLPWVFPIGTENLRRRLRSLYLLRGAFGGGVTAFCSCKKSSSRFQTPSLPKYDIIRNVDFYTAIQALQTV